MFTAEPMVPRRGLEPPRFYPLVPETSASTNSATWAIRGGNSGGGPGACQRFSGRYTLRQGCRRYHARNEEQKDPRGRQGPHLRRPRQAGQGAGQATQDGQAAAVDAGEHGGPGQAERRQEQGRGEEQRAAAEFRARPPRQARCTPSSRAERSDSPPTGTASRGAGR